MIFMLFAVGIAAIFFACSLVCLRLGLDLGLRHRKLNGPEGTAGLATVEGAIFGLMGVATGVHNFWRVATVRRPPTTCYSGGDGGHNGL